MLGDAERVKELILENRYNKFQFIFAQTISLLNQNWKTKQERNMVALVSNGNMPKAFFFSKMTNMRQGTSKVAKMLFFEFAFVFCWLLGKQPTFKE